MRPIIGIPARQIEFEGIARFAMATTYTRALERAGGAPLIIPLELGAETLRAIFARLDGLLFAGGVDVHPKEFGEPIETFCGAIETDRDEIELKLARWAIAENKPILGICRGIQLINIAAGGSLYQDIAAQVPDVLHHPHIKGNSYGHLAHTIEIAPGSRLSRALGATQMQVNSLHHQSLKAIAPGFQIVARAPDGIVEGIESRNGAFAVAVQFHPEWMQDDDARVLNLFRDFVDVARAARPQ
ncbi:MAG: gamma-glutamyl-gamma-aminobutyrate hydrolase family protein [Chloroflexi bacterium]|nr:gamma-glutamyl-gamma-aminobutyrate hydrolase family protein [Chloroflexota bacterium]